MIYDTATPRGPRIYGVVPGMSVAKPAYRKTAPVVVRNNYCSARLQGVFYARPVNSPRNMYSAANHDIGIRLIVGDELCICVRNYFYYLLSGSRDEKTRARSVILGISNSSSNCVIRSILSMIM